MAAPRQHMKNFAHSLYSVSVESVNRTWFKGPYNQLPTAKGVATRLRKEYPKATITVLACLQPDWEEVLD